MPSRLKKWVQDPSGLTTKLPSEQDTVYTPRSEYHSRFGTNFQMLNSAQWNTYHRSDFKLLQGVKKDDFKFTGNQSAVMPGMYPKIGNFFNPLEFKRYQNAVEPLETRPKPKEPAYLYDSLLEFQKTNARYVVQKVSEKNNSISINADNNYTCVLVSIPKPNKKLNAVLWSQLFGVFLIPIANKLAWERGLNVELVYRSSFGCLRPSIAACDESLRINLGLTPVVYAECIAEAILYTQKLLQNEAVFADQFAPLSLVNTLKKYCKKRSTDKKEVTVQLEDTLWETLWAPADAKGGTFIKQLFRTSLVTEYLIDLIFDGCLKHTIADIFNKPLYLKETFAAPLKTILSSLHLTASDTLSVNSSNFTLKTYQWTAEKVVPDAVFWSMFKKFGLALNAKSDDITSIVSRKTLSQLHHYLEILQTQFMFQPVPFKSIDDGCGSDSEEEDEWQDKKKNRHSIFAKKMITATGMRAIQLIFAASKLYLNETYGIDALDVDWQAEDMYYETDDALKKHAIPLEIDNEGDSKKKSSITFFDVNHCNTSHKEPAEIEELVGKKDRICSIDTTSATTSEINAILKQLFFNYPKLDAVLSISSGLKNEQAMSDLNPYGTVRLFARNKKALTSLYDFLIQLEEEAQCDNEDGYQHPKLSHLLRKAAKHAGMTPTNSSILNP